MVYQLDMVAPSRFHEVGLPLPHSLGGEVLEKREHNLLVTGWGLDIRVGQKSDPFLDPAVEEPWAPYASSLETTSDICGTAYYNNIIEILEE